MFDLEMVATVEFMMSDKEKTKAIKSIDYTIDILRNFYNTVAGYEGNIENLKEYDFDCYDLESTADYLDSFLCYIKNEVK